MLNALVYEATSSYPSPRLSSLPAVIARWLAGAVLPHRPQRDCKPDVEHLRSPGDRARVCSSPSIRTTRPARVFAAAFGRCSRLQTRHGRTFSRTKCNGPRFRRHRAAPRTLDRDAAIISLSVSRSYCPGWRERGGSYGATPLLMTRLPPQKLYGRLCSRDRCGSGAAR